MLLTVVACPSFQLSTFNFQLPRHCAAYFFRGPLRRVLCLTLYPK